MNTDQKTKLKAFAASSNWSMLFSHSSDKQNWETFMAAAKANPNDIADGEVYGVIKGVTTNPCPDDIAGRMEYLCRKGKLGRIKRFVAGVKEAMKGWFGLACLMMPLMSVADIKVSDVKVFSGYPWKEVVIGYTITGTDDNADAVRLTATDKSANKSYTAITLWGAKLTEGRHTMRWNASAEDVKFSSTNVVFEVSVNKAGVQLWENGPYWAECNVGATKPEEYGYYFWWGDAVGYKHNANGWVSVENGSLFSFDSGHCPTYGMSNSQLQSAGYIDATGNLDVTHDAATAHFGALWRMPTKAELGALINKCTTTWTTRNGVYGRLVEGKGIYATKNIFLPAAGSGSNSGVNSRSAGGYYRCSTPNSDDSNCAHILFFYSSEFEKINHSPSIRLDDQFDRSLGLSVRPVRGFAH